MPKCAVKRTCMAYSVFVGDRTAETVLPKWLKDAYDSVYEDEYRYWVTAKIKLIGGGLVPFDEVLLEGYDIFLRNFAGRVMRITLDQFNSDLEMIADGTVARKQDAYSYFVYSEKTPIEDYGDEERYIIETRKPKDSDVFIRTGEGKYNHMPYCVFRDRYYFLGNGIDWDKFYE